MAQISLCVVLWMVNDGYLYPSDSNALVACLIAFLTSISGPIVGSVVILFAVRKSYSWKLKLAYLPTKETSTSIVYTVRSKYVSYPVTQSRRVTGPPAFIVQLNVACVWEWTWMIKTCWSKCLAHNIILWTFTIDLLSTTHTLSWCWTMTCSGAYPSIAMQSGLASSSHGVAPCCTCFTYHHITTITLIELLEGEYTTRVGMHTAIIGLFEVFHHFRINFFACYNHTINHWSQTHITRELPGMLMLQQNATIGPPFVLVCDPSSFRATSSAVNMVVGIECAWRVSFILSISALQLSNLMTCGVACQHQINGWVVVLLLSHTFLPTFSINSACATFRPTLAEHQLSLEIHPFNNVFTMSCVTPSANGMW